MDGFYDGNVSHDQYIATINKPNNLGNIYFKCGFLLSVDKNIGYLKVNGNLVTPLTGIDLSTICAVASQKHGLIVSYIKKDGLHVYYSSTNKTVKYNAVGGIVVSNDKDDTYLVYITDYNTVFVADEELGVFGEPKLIKQLTDEEAITSYAIDIDDMLVDLNLIKVVELPKKSPPPKPTTPSNTTNVTVLNIKDLISQDTNNSLILGSDEKLYVFNAVTLSQVDW